MSFKLFASYLPLILGVALLAGCRHGIEITGQGNVVSASGSRDCARNEAPCRFEVEGAYTETFTAIPATGWLHDAWERCQAPSGNQCSFDIAADVVADFTDAEIPGAIARFRLPIEPAFRNANGAFVLPAGSATEQLAWVLGELRAPSTTIAEIREHFSSDYLARNPANQVQQLLSDLRNAVSNPEIADLLTATPTSARAVVLNQGANAGGLFLSINSNLVSGGLITEFSATTGFPRGGSNVAASEAGNSLEQLGDKFSALASNTSMLVARIDNDQCRSIFEKDAQTPRPTGSIFKLWVLGAVAEEIRAGRLAATTMVPFDLDEVVIAGGAINDTPAGTQLSIRNLANLMLGVSDNTSTDLLHELVGRNRVEEILRTFGRRNRDLMTPFLSTNEQFHILWTLSPELASHYAAAPNAEQRDILINSIEPLGPVTQFVQANQTALFDSSWAASAFDVCRAYAGLRRFDNRSPEFEIIEESAGAETALLSVRTRWDRVWSKGGSLANANGNYVFTLSWLFESDDKGAYVVVLMTSNRDGSPIDGNPLFSIGARAEEILFNR